MDYRKEFLEKFIQLYTITEQEEIERVGIELLKVDRSKHKQWFNVLNHLLGECKNEEETIKLLKELLNQFKL